jgi:3-hydroxyisobutyrate dehydrogenase-like beta-hydroxyacid dehydrogenase
MQLEVLSGRIGEAAAVKMCRSIVVKGLESLRVECVVAANRCGATDRVFASLAESFPGPDWEKLAGYMLSRSALHGRRRAREMEEVARTLEDIGIEPIMSSATARRQQWCADLELARRFGSAPPDDAREIAEAIEEILTGASTPRVEVISPAGKEGIQ